jgi:hypothetical protein
LDVWACAGVCVYRRPIGGGQCRGKRTNTFHNTFEPRESSRKELPAHDGSVSWFLGMAQRNDIYFKKNQLEREKAMYTESR